MREIERGMYAVSLAGHDKGKLYVVWKANERFAWLVDGKNRTQNCPKKKSFLHLQVDYARDEILAQKLDAGSVIYEEEIRGAIRRKVGGMKCQKQM